MGEAIEVVSIEEPPEFLPAPISGEAIPIRQIVEKPEIGAEWLTTLRNTKSQIDLAIRAVSDALVLSSERYGTQTIPTSAGKVKVTHGKEVEWDLAILRELLEAGLPRARYESLVKSIVSYKVDGRVAKQISAANPKYAEIIGRAKREIEKRPSVSIEGGRS